MPVPIRPNGFNVESDPTLVPDLGMGDVDIVALMGGLGLTKQADAGDAEAEMLFDLWQNSKITINGQHLQDRTYIAGASFPQNHILRLRGTGLIEGERAALKFTDRAARVIRTMVLGEDNNFRKNSVKKSYSIILANSKPSKSKGLSRKSMYEGDQLDKLRDERTFCPECSQDISAYESEGWQHQCSHTPKLREINQEEEAHLFGKPSAASTKANQANPKELNPLYYNKAFQAEALKWWGTLSINEMKAFEDKYHAIHRPATPGTIAEIYDHEVDPSKTAAPDIAGDLTMDKNLFDSLRPVKKASIEVSAEDAWWNRQPRVREYTFPSSDNKRTYTTILYDNGQATCNCRGWTTKRKCWHKDEVEAKPEAENLRSPQKAPPRAQAPLSDRERARELARKVAPEIAKKYVSQPSKPSKPEIAKTPDSHRSLPPDWTWTGSTLEDTASGRKIDVKSNTAPFDVEAIAWGHWLNEHFGQHYALKKKQGKAGGTPNWAVTDEATSFEFPVRLSPRGAAIEVSKSISKSVGNEYELPEGYTLSTAAAGGVVAKGPGGKSKEYGEIWAPSQVAADIWTDWVSEKKRSTGWKIVHGPTGFSARSQHNPEVLGPVDTPKEAAEMVAPTGTKPMSPSKSQEAAPDLLADDDFETGGLLETLRPKAKPTSRLSGSAPRILRISDKEL